MFNDVLSHARGHHADLGRVVIQHPNLSNPIVVPLQQWENIDADTVMDEISKVLNSNEGLDVDENMVVTVGTIDLPKGGAKKPITRLSGPANSLQKKRSLIYVENDNNLCLAISVALCFLKTCTVVDADHSLVKESTRLDHILKCRTVFKNVLQSSTRKKRKKLGMEIAVDLCKRTGLPTTRYLGLNDIPKFEQLLNVNIFVVSSRVSDKFVRILDNDDRPNLYLYHIETEAENHWHGIVNIQGFFKGAYFCKNCKQPFN
ncbi:hypothetical protein FSP39_001588 [Pinctada imbricata]|uniref:Uncharacterized protein n=1 Tax=Pinctada imbricata TaxID=66713 RepID=A0AA89BPC9_PINIB|nr:hypothetical protein FSP39_001588 [Pinctada imbricata]